MDQLNPKAQSIVTDPRSLRTCILFQHLRGIPVFDAYTEMSKIFGEHFMEYLHYEYWYMGLANGSLNVDSSDRFHSTERKEFIGITTLVQEICLDKLDPMDRFTASVVCHHFKSIIDNQRSNLKKITIYPEGDNVDLNVNDGYVSYNLKNDNCLVNYGKQKLLYVNKRPLEVAINHVSRLLKCRGLNLDYFAVQWIHLWENEKAAISLDAIKNVLQSVGILKAKSVLIFWPHIARHVELLEHFNPENLEDLTIKSYESDDDSVNNLVRLEQWKQSNTLTLSDVPNFPLIVRHLVHFKSLNFDFMRDTFSTNDIIRLRDEVLLTSTKFEYFTCKINRFDAEMLVRVFDPFSTQSGSTGSIVYRTENGTFDMAYQPDGFNIKKRIDLQH